MKKVFPPPKKKTPWKNVTVRKYQYARFKAKIPNLKKRSFSDFFSFFFILHFTVTFSQAIFSKNKKTLL